SPYHFHRMFKSVVSENVNAYIRRVRTEKASRMLAFQERMSLTDIGLECGFPSLSSFSRAFRHIRGLSPSEYRRRFAVFETREITFAAQRFRRTVARMSGGLPLSGVDRTVRWALRRMIDVAVVHLPA